MLGLRSSLVLGSVGKLRPRFLLFVVCLLLVTGSWALATPPFASPDEPAHVYRAVAVVTGELLPPIDELPGGAAEVDVPAGLVDSAERIGCYTFRPEVPASCVGESASGAGWTQAVTSAARYHPVYYAVVGWPAVILSGDSALFAMRLLSALLVSVFVALGLQSAWEHPRGRLLVAGSFVALTPMVLFLGGVVNPNSVEIAAAFAVWASGLTLISCEDRDRQEVLVRRLGLAAVVMVTARTISPLWLFVTLVLLAVLARWARLMSLAALPATRLWAAVVALATLASVGWTVLAGANPIPPDRSDPTSFPSAVRLVLEAMPLRLDQYVGRFGWLDTYSPTFSLVAITAVAGFLMLLGLLMGGRREALVLVVLIMCVVALPVLIEAWQFNSTGYFWQMRYQQPLTFGIPMVAAVSASAGLARSGPRLETRSAWLLVGLAVPAQLLCFAWALRRYTVGQAAPLGVLSGTWAPPTGTATLIVLHVLGLLLLALAVLYRARRPRVAPEETTDIVRPMATATL